MTPRGRARRRRRGIGGEGGKKRRRSRGVVRRRRGRCRLVFIARPGVNKGAEAYYRRECSYIALPVFHPGHLPCTTRLILPLPPPRSPSPAPSTTAPPTAPPRVSAEGPRRRTRPARGKAGGGQPERTRPAGRGPSPEHARAVRLCLLSSLRRWTRLCWLAPWPWPYGSNRIRNNFISISFSPRFLQCPLFFFFLRNATGPRCDSTSQFPVRMKTSRDLPPRPRPSRPRPSRSGPRRGEATRPLHRR